MEGFFVFGIAQFQFVMCFPKLIHGIFKQISNTSSKNWSLSYLCVNRFLNRTQSFTGGAISNFAQWEGSWEFHYQTNASYCTHGVFSTLSLCLWKSMEMSKMCFVTLLCKYSLWRSLRFWWLFVFTSAEQSHGSFYELRKLLHFFPTQGGMSSMHFPKAKLQSVYASSRQKGVISQFVRYPTVHSKTSFALTTCCSRPLGRKWGQGWGHFLRTLLVRPHRLLTQGI